ncbi:hypothetical protein FQN54_004079 [Arachnomyces sp. PD_36]|nr:hypothetical protein FQN54_004079 [Arachnomyces sp. PD_36]
MANITSVTLETPDSYHLVGEFKNPITKMREMADKDEVNPVPAETPPDNDPTCNIRYTYICDNSRGADFVKKSDNIPLDLRITKEAEDESEEKPPRVFEVVTEVRVSSDRRDRYPRSTSDDEDEDEDEDESRPLGNVQIKNIGKRRIIIHSKLLLDAIREVVRYYPSQNLLGDTVTVREPYGVLMHHLAGLKKVKSKLEEMRSRQIDDSIAEKSHHIQILLDFLDGDIQSTIKPAQKRLEKPAPTVIFDDIWYLLRPGLLSYFIHDGVWLGCVIKAVTRKMNDDALHVWEVDVWFQDNSWTKGDIGGASAQVVIMEFDGEKFVTSLDVFPRDYFDSKDEGERKVAFQKRGGIVCDILWKGYSYVNHDGKLMDDSKQQARSIPETSIDTWTVINVDSIYELDKPDKVPEANIGAENFKIIKALSDRQINSKVPWSADFIKNKGEGVAVLLHGPPGVGKTYTVETTALSTGRPLISLTIADLGTKEERIEAELDSWFTLAHRWRAILLIDEADIFLERREHKDISRNGIVSVFLRKMEYFGGLLFLTTNRVGHIDEAFISRVHVIVGFEKLDANRRKAIWKSFLDKLAHEMKGQIRVLPSARNFIMGEEMSAMDWNGREIRNALQTAIALAEHDTRSGEEYTEGDEIVVESDHFRKVRTMSRSFRTYMDSIRRDTEEERARIYYGRNDFRRQKPAGVGNSLSDQ